MKTNLNADVFRSLRAARRRLRTQLFLERLIDFAFYAALVLLVSAAAQRWLLHGGWLEARWFWIALAVVFVGALSASLVRRFEWKEVAKCVDRLGQTRDRFLTALTFSEAPSAFQNLAAQECRVFLTRKNFARLVPIRVPAHARFLIVPIVALALLQWEARLGALARQHAADLAQAEVSPTTRQLEQLAREIEQTDEPARAEELKKIAEQLRRSAEQLRAQNNGADEAAKAALRELSKLEQMLQQMQQSPANASPEELKQLAKALEENAATKDAAQAMQAGNLAEAAKQLDEAAQQEPAREEAEKTLREALERLAQQRQLSDALQKLAKQMQQSQGPGGKQDQALQKLAEMLRQMAPQQGSQPGEGRQPSEQTLKNLLAALQNMKFGDGQPQPGGEGAPKGNSPPGQVTVQSFADANLGDQPPPDSSQIPSGKPGGERDKGTTETPFGQQPGDRRDDGQNAALKGRLADGESLSQLLPTTGDTSKAQRRYKELYDAMAPAAQDAVVQENIPLGSRFFIRRYFESIRPKE